MEPISVACWRQLPSIHPLWKLLQPHVRGVLAINTLGRERLIPAGGVADNTLSLGGGGMKELTIGSLSAYVRPVMNARGRSLSTSESSRATLAFRVLTNFPSAFIIRRTHANH